MAKILFIQEMWVEYNGPMYLSSYIKKAGHSCDLVIGSTPQDFYNAIKKQKPDFLGFSCMSGLHVWALEIALELKRTFSIRTIFGGPHATFFPDIINHPGVDIICRGEGEAALLELLNSVDNGNKDVTDIDNLWFKSDGEVVKNGIGMLVNDLDTIPYPDRSIYYKYSFLRNNPSKMFIASRGCPYNCTYCYNDTLKELYRGKGKYVRYRSVDNILGEIEDIKDRYGMKIVKFMDDTFTLNKRWTLDFFERYKKKFDIPFFCRVRVGHADEELIRGLKESGCHSVFFGLESGVEEIRKNILGKDISNKEIIDTAAILKKYKIKFLTYNMVGMPGETTEDAFETIKLNAKIKTDYPWCSIFTPYPGTKVADYVIEKGLVDKDFSKNFFTISYHKEGVMNQGNRDEITNLHDLFSYGVKFPVLIPLIKRLIKLPPNKAYKILFSLSYFYHYLRSEKSGFYMTFLLGLRTWNIFLGSRRVKQKKQDLQLNETN